MEEQKKKRAVTFLEQSVSPVKVEPKPRAVTESPKKKPRNNGDDTANGELGDQKKPVVDSVAEDLSSFFDEAKDTKSEEKGDTVTAETVMKFRSCPGKTNREIVTENPGFVLWARDKEKSGAAFGNLKRFLEWLDTPEGQFIELGSEKFGGFGKHAEETFEQIAKSDPGYHVRWMNALESKGEEPSEKLALYISFFEKYKDKLKPDDSKGHANQTITFGKYSGKSYQEVAKIDPEYHVRFRKALERKGEKPTPELVEYVDWYRANVGPDPENRSFRTRNDESGNQRFTFGRHKGETYRSVAKNDPSYHLRYMEMNPDEARYKLRGYMEYFENHGNMYEAQIHHRADLISRGVYFPFF